MAERAESFSSLKELLPSGSRTDQAIMRLIVYLRMRRTISRNMMTWKEYIGGYQDPHDQQE